MCTFRPFEGFSAARRGLKLPLESRSTATILHANSPRSDRFARVPPQLRFASLPRVSARFPPVDIWLTPEPWMTSLLPHPYAPGTLVKFSETNQPYLIEDKTPQSSNHNGSVTAGSGECVSSQSRKRVILGQVQLDDYVIARLAAISFTEVQENDTFFYIWKFKCSGYNCWGVASRSPNLTARGYHVRR